jgi:hypothetical protein
LVQETENLHNAYDALEEAFLRLRTPTRWQNSQQ